MLFYILHEITFHSYQKVFLVYGAPDHNPILIVDFDKLAFNLRFNVELQLDK